MSEYYIFSFEHSGWWMPGGRRYTKQLSEAGVYSRVAAAEIEQGVIVLIDLDWGGRSITNNAEAVIDHMRHHFDLTAHRVIYRDTTGLWDGLAVDQTGHFAGFVMLQVPSREAAIAAAVSRETWSAR